MAGVSEEMRHRHHVVLGERSAHGFSEIKSVFVDYSGTLQRAQIDNR